MSSFLTCRPCAPRTPISDGKTIAEPVTSPVVVPKVKFLEQMVRLLLALLQQLGSYGTTPGPMLLPTTVQFRPAIGLSERSYSPTYSFPEEIHPCSPQTGNQAQTDEDLSTPPIIGGCAQHSPCIFYLWKAIALRELDNIPQGTGFLFRDDIIGSPQSSRTAFYGCQLSLKYLWRYLMNISISWYHSYSLKLLEHYMDSGLP
ncbi:hypothetical protein LEMLEM_LOCUS4413 [Lemmus lemmus]